MLFSLVPTVTATSAATVQNGEFGSEIKDKFKVLELSDLQLNDTRRTVCVLDTHRLSTSYNRQRRSTQR